MVSICHDNVCSLGRFTCTETELCNLSEVRLISVVVLMTSSDPEKKNDLDSHSRKELHSVRSLMWSSTPAGKETEKPPDKNHVVSTRHLCGLKQASGRHGSTQFVLKNICCTLLGRTHNHVCFPEFCKKSSLHAPKLGRAYEIHTNTDILVKTWR